MDEHKKNNLRAIGIGLLVGIAVFFGLRSCGPTKDNNDINTTVRQIEANNDRAGHAVESARGEIQSAQSELHDAAENVSGAYDTASDIQKSITDNQRTLDEIGDILNRSRELIEEKQRIFDDIEAANQQSAASEKTQSN